MPIVSAARGPPVVMATVAQLLSGNDSDGGRARCTGASLYGDTYGGGFRYDGVTGDLPRDSRPFMTTAGGGTYSSMSS